ncbi:MAG: prolipoprotein diacylglyceryl transferase [Leptospirales bacterium]|nr:prolipoprotein diacylglyceryl transferase [Leptospirales bacterium]
MYPTFFTYKFITIGSFGLLLGAAFFIAFLLLEREFILKSIDPELAYKILITIIPSAIVGAKIFHVIENFTEFLADPFGILFSGAGLSVYGGFILSFIAGAILIKKNNENPLRILDIASPPMALGYAIGRLGCHASGDGCYGIHTESFLGVAYPNGIVPTSAVVFPTPLFESFASLIFFIILMRLRKKELKTGVIFFIYLIMNGCARFAVEFIRVNPVTAIGLTQAQIIAICFILAGSFGIYYMTKDRLRDNMV